MEGSTRLFELLADALALPLAERAAFLSAACEGDAALLTEAQSLLGHETGAREFLEEPAFRLDPETLPEPTTGELAACTLLGEYEIVRLLGQGGMGEVYLARGHQVGSPPWRSSCSSAAWTKPACCAVSSTNRPCSPR